MPPKRTRRRRLRAATIIRIPNEPGSFSLDEIDTVENASANEISRDTETTLVQDCDETDLDSNNLSAQANDQGDLEPASEVSEVTEAELADGGNIFSPKNTPKKRSDIDGGSNSSPEIKSQKRQFTVEYKLSIVAQAKKSTNRQVAK